MITTNYPDSNVASFDFKEIYLGCVLTAGVSRVGAVPQSCSVSFTGYQGSDNQLQGAKQVCAFSTTYTPGKLLLSLVNNRRRIC
jgi:hypothetical protein